MRKASKLLAIALAAVMALGFTGCGGSGSDGEIKAVPKDKIKVGVIHIGDPAAGSGYTPAHDAGIVAMQETLGLTDDQIKIVRTLGERTMQVDDIIEETEIPTRRVLSALTMLELDGVVEQSSGKRFALAVTLAGQQ